VLANGGPEGQTNPGFSICVVNRVDKRVRREYELSAEDSPGVEATAGGAAIYTGRTASAVAARPHSANRAPSQSFFQRLKTD